MNNLVMGNTTEIVGKLTPVKIHNVVKTLNEKITPSALHSTSLEYWDDAAIEKYTNSSYSEDIKAMLTKCEKEAKEGHFFAIFDYASAAMFEDFKSRGFNVEWNHTCLIIGW